ncbi:hypothetical protein JTB14_028550 [Gonioctena quinquepunctata]|nr:hypothetical protein JTB14_028550 [Gonioctena quinquepunctata]
MKLAYEIAKKNNSKTRFNDQKKSAGKEWYAGFMKRHPNVSLRLPEAISLARAVGFNKTVVYKFFDIYEEIIEENGISADPIFNADETSHTVVQKPQKIIAQKRKHQIGAITSSKRGQNVTGMYAMSATGSFIPPMLIFARKRMKDSLTYGAPPGTLFECQHKGWMDADGFYHWLDHFIKYAKPSKENKVLIVLDGHSCHTQSMKALELARDHGVIMLSFPEHCTLKMQPLDVGFFKPLNTSFASAVTTKLYDKPGKCSSVDNISYLVGKSFPRAATMDTALNSFRKTGLWPPDRFVYSDVDFAAATVSERPINLDENDINISVTDSATPPPPENINLLTNETQPSTSQSVQQGNTHLNGYPIHVTTC